MFQSLLVGTSGRRARYNARTDNTKLKRLNDQILGELRRAGRGAPFEVSGINNKAKSWKRSWHVVHGSADGNRSRRGTAEDIKTITGTHRIAIVGWVVLGLRQCSRSCQMLIPRSQVLLLEIRPPTKSAKSPST